MEADKVLNNIKPEEYFYLKNGRVLKNLYEFTNSLASMDDETFKHHVNKERNDFAEWIRHVLKDEGLANQISRLKNRGSILKKINKRLSNAGKKKKIEEKKPHFWSKAGKQKEDAAKSAVLGGDKSAAAKSKEQTTGNEHHQEVIRKLDEILLKEKELNKREQKVQEIEQRIEKKLAKAKKNNNTNGAGTEAKFFSREFVQGLLTGLLITSILSLIYIKFYY